MVILCSMASSGHVLELTYFDERFLVFAVFRVQIHLLISVKLRPRQYLLLKSGTWCCLGFAPLTGASILVLSIGLAGPFNGC